MPSKTSHYELSIQIEKLQKRKKLLIVKSAERFARAATKAGLAEIEISDDQLDAFFTEIAARFRNGERQGSAVAPPQTGRPADRAAGAAAEVSHDS